MKTNNFLEISGGIYFRDRDITEKEQDEFLSSFIDFVEARGMMFQGITTIKTDKDSLMEEFLNEKN